MSANQPPASQIPSRPDAIKFLYKDGLLPVAHAKAKAIALGKPSDPRSDILDDYICWQGTTDGNGEIWLSDPTLLQSMDIVAEKVKRENKGALNDWFYAPLPRNRPMDVPGARRTPRIPLIAEIDDDAVGAPTLQVDLIPQAYITNQARPPLGELNGNSFMDPGSFLRALAQRFANMDRDRSSVSLKLTRCGSPAPRFMLDPVWGHLELALGTTRSDFQITTAYTKKFRDVRDHVGVNVLRKILPSGGVSTAKSVADLYEGLINQVAGTSRVGPLTRLNVSDLQSGIASAMGKSTSGSFEASPMEDYALTGAILFIIGAIVRGYLWGTLRTSTGTNIELSANINTTTACKVDEFDSYCELMKP